MWIYDSETLVFLDVNAAAIAHYGYSREEFLSMRITDIRPPEDVARVLQLIELRRRGEVDYFQPAGAWRHRLRDGRIIDVEIVSHPIDIRGGKAVLVVANDVTDRKRAEEDLRKSEERYRLLFERNLAGVYRNTMDGKVLDANDACARILGFASREELMSRSALHAYFDPAEREYVMGRLREAGKLTNFEIRLRRHDNEPVWVLQNMTMVGGDGPGIIEGTMVDITAQKDAEERAAYLAYHDALTDLPNRSLLKLRLKLALSHSIEHRLQHALLYLDLDHFSDVNGTFGHTVGDELLRAVAVRLKTTVAGDQMLARVAGDEFVIALHGLTSSRSVATAATRVLDLFHQPFEIGGNVLYAGASIGIAISPDDGDDAETLLKNASSAVHRAKVLGRGRYQLCNATMTKRVKDRLAVENGLRRALARDELLVYYQPQFDVETRRLVGAEALVRWRRQDHQILEPIDFLGVAEESDLILPIGEWVLRQACSQAQAWQENGLGPLRLAVNVSARQLQSDLIATVARALSDTGFDPHLLDIEITESAAMQTPDMTLLLLQGLRTMGIRISVDDFGTGHSSLNYLKKFPIDFVKIDQVFVRDVPTSETDRSIVSAIITLAHGMKLRVIAEGVENEEQVDFLRQQHCEQMQGFLMARPLPPDVFERMWRGAHSEHAGVSSSPA